MANLKALTKQSQIKKKLLPKTIYRVEDWSGTGPYQANLWQRLFRYGKDAEVQWKENQKNFPGFKQDFPGANRDYISGTFRKEDLDKWFSDFYEILDKEGFLLAEYISEDYIPGISGKQVAFNSETARKVSRKKLS